MIRFLSFRLLRRSAAHPQETGSDLHKAQVSKCMDQNHPVISPFLETDSHGEKDSQQPWEKPRLAFTPSGQADWKQRGNSLYKLLPSPPPP